MEGEKSVGKSRGIHYNPDHAKQLMKVRDVMAKERAFAETHLSMPIRVQTVSMRLLRFKRSGVVKKS